MDDPHGPQTDDWSSPPPGFRSFSQRRIDGMQRAASIGSAAVRSSALGEEALRSPATETAFRNCRGRKTLVMARRVCETGICPLVFATGLLIRQRRRIPSVLPFDHIRTEKDSMIRRTLLVVSAVGGIVLVGAVDRVSAQGLLWSLPKEDFTEVRYEGEYSQVESRPNAPEGDLKVEPPWTRKLWLRSVGREEWEYDKRTKTWQRAAGGKAPQDDKEIVWCRWIEIELVTGKIQEGTVDPGPVGARLYKVLVPERHITGNRVDSQQIHVSYIPICGRLPPKRGWRGGEAQNFGAPGLSFVVPTDAL